MKKESLGVGILIDPDYGDNLSYSITLLEQEFTKHGHTVTLYRTCDISLVQIGKKTTIYHQDEPLDKLPDLLVNRHNVLNCTGHDIQIVSALEEQGVISLNSIADSYITHDKFKLNHLLINRGIPMPQTARVGLVADLSKISKQLGGFPLVVKANTSNQGKGVMFVSELLGLKSLVDYLWHERHEFYIQKFVPEAAENCYRAVVVDGKAVTIYGRLSDKDEFRSNLKEGSFGGFVKPTKQEAAIFSKLARILKLEILGIDFARTKNGMCIIEVNAYPGLAQIYKQSKLNLAPYFYEAAMNKYERS